MGRYQWREELAGFSHSEYFLSGIVLRVGQRQRALTFECVEAPIERCSGHAQVLGGLGGLFAGLDEFRCGPDLLIGER